MLYNSTQNSSEVVSAAQAIAQGISKDGGLFVPQEFPKINNETFKALLNVSESVNNRADDVRKFIKENKLEDYIVWL